VQFGIRPSRQLSMYAFSTRTTIARASLEWQRRDSLVLILLYAVSPLAVIGGIWPIVILPLDSKPSWPVFHVADKVCKRIEPSLADVNSSSTIVLEAFVSGIVASILHPVVHFPERMTAKSVGPVSFRQHFTAKTSTALCPSVQRNLSDRARVTTVTNKGPSRSVGGATDESGDNQTPVPLSCDVHKIWGPFSFSLWHTLIMEHMFGYVH
jgi:hypothetical protein